MIPAGIMGGGAELHRKFKVAANMTNGQIACYSAAIALAAAPASNSSYANAIGIVLDSANATYTTTQGNGANSADVLVDITYSPLQMYRGRVSSNIAGYVAQAAATPALAGAILLNSTANTAGTVIADANVGTANYTNGMVVGLTGNNAGQSRGLTAYSANTSQTVTVPFDYTIAANDTFIRTFKPMSRGMILTTDYKDFYQIAASGTCPTTGNSWVVDVELDTFTINSHQIPIVNSTSPVQWLLCMFYDHVFNAIE